MRTEHSNEYNLYADYMGNPEKTTGIFTAEKDYLHPKEKQILKKQLSQAQEKGSLMWQTVLSFDNRWLAEQGVYDLSAEILDEKKLQEATRNAVNKMLKQEGLENAIWSAAIHYNTDNIHVHIATVEPEPMRQKKEYIQYHMVEKDGKKVKEPILDWKGQPVKKEEYVGRFKQKSINTCKSVMVNELLNDRENNLKINQIIRGSILAQKRNHSFVTDREFAKSFISLYEKMPDCDRKMWVYNSNQMNEVREDINKLSKQYMEKYHRKEYKELVTMLKIQDEKYRQAYGGKNKASYEDTKIKDLYTRMGNCVLSELRNYDRNLKELPRESDFHRREGKNQVRQRWLLSSALRNLKKSMKSEYEKHLNEREHDQLSTMEER